MTSPDESARQGIRRRSFLFLATVACICLLTWGLYWILHSRHFESTDNAYVGADIVQITAQIPGTATAVRVDEMQSVSKGQLLLELDPADAKVALASAEAGLASAVRQVRGQFALVNQLRSELVEREAAQSGAEEDLRRREALIASRLISDEELSHAQNTVAGLVANVGATREQLAAALAQVDGMSIEAHPHVQKAAATVREALLTLARTKLRAPVAGVIARKAVQAGQRVAPGVPLMSVVRLDDVWVDANFREVQLERMRVGQPATLFSDVFGSGVRFRGQVRSLAAGTGAAFSVLPPQNASGNWIKIVQRVPVRIALDPADLKAHPLRVGLSMHVEVDVRETSGAMAPVQTRAADPVSGADPDEAAVARRLRDIIRDNSGAGPR